MFRKTLSEGYKISGKHSRRCLSIPIDRTLTMGWIRLISNFKSSYGDYWWKSHGCKSTVQFIAMPRWKYFNCNVYSGSPLKSSGRQSRRVIKAPENILARFWLFRLTKHSYRWLTIYCRRMKAKLCSLVSYLLVKPISWMREYRGSLLAR